MNETIEKPDRTQIVLAIQKHNGNKQISLYSPEVNALVAEGFVRDYPDPFAVMDIEQMGEYLSDTPFHKWAMRRDGERQWVVWGPEGTWVSGETAEQALRDACREIAGKYEHIDAEGKLSTAAD
jgi:hypothetical protein